MSILLGSKPLILAVLGIAFAAYMTLFVRQSLLYEGEAPPTGESDEPDEAFAPADNSDTADAAASLAVLALAGVALDGDERKKRSWPW